MKVFFQLVSRRIVSEKTITKLSNSFFVVYLNTEKYSINRSNRKALTACDFKCQWSVIATHIPLRYCVKCGFQLCFHQIKIHKTKTKLALRNSFIFTLTDPKYTVICNQSNLEWKTHKCKEIHVDFNIPCLLCSPFIYDFQNTAMRFQYTHAQALIAQSELNEISI